MLQEFNILIIMKVALIIISRYHILQQKYKYVY